MNTNNKNTIVWDKASNTMRMDTYGENDEAQKQFFEVSLHALMDCLMESKDASSGNEIVKALANYDDVKGDVRHVDFIVKMDDNQIGRANCFDAFNLAGNLNWFRSRGFGVNGFIVSNGHAVITLIKTNTSGSLGARVIRAFCELMAA